VKKSGGLLLKTEKPVSFRFPSNLETGRLHLKRKVRDLEFPLAGRGTIAVSSDARWFLRFDIRIEKVNRNILYLLIGLTECVLLYGNIEDISVLNIIIPITILKTDKVCYINPGIMTTYWFFLDNPNRIISYSKYYINKSIRLFEVKLKFQTGEGRMAWSDAANHSWLDNVKKVIITQDGGVGVSILLEIWHNKYWHLLMIFRSSQN
jgi:hypothetical protein